MTEAESTQEAREQLDREWGVHWDSDATHLLEKSPSSILRMRYLQVQLRSTQHASPLLPAAAHPPWLPHRCDASGAA